MADWAWMARGDRGEPETNIDFKRLLVAIHEVSNLLTPGIGPEQAADAFMVPLFGEPLYEEPRGATFAECFPTNSPTCDEVREYLTKLLHDVVAQKGKIQVRYLGDLKTQDYDLQARFFHVDAAADMAEFIRDLRDALLSSGGREAVFINLANVRDIRVAVGHPDFVKAERHISHIRAVISVLESWAAGCPTVTLVHS